MKAEEYVVEALLEANDRIKALENRVSTLKKNLIELSEKLHVLINSKSIEVNKDSICFWLFSNSEGYKEFRELYGMYHVEEVKEEEEKEEDERN